ncbi:ABC-type bacteriocin/lantibiotic exporter, contains an N-terminal double-glycine peptidase domain [Paenibacillus sophorae]|uniref:Peptidase C39 n=2 Tax=Paenibacillus TaxID=44249 RepID=A0A089HX92_PAEDU|nr:MULTISPECIES: peptidase domain-containing ABC transporter [Paenibacillus]AIQ14968.1 peptidase C39 [Paenibacillus durus]QWU15998.1 peptidase domain-containing ABC transporter [Paenibacillus sophorae]SEN69084.1 ABC-type bacteriocin/lantibiotic exporter, contains an N-terminal double-glycine peptidase domain [Paenibacillus sophorae]
MFINRTPFVEQMQQTECGICCISMVAGKYNAHKTLRELRNMAGIGRDGVTLYTMRNTAVRLGFKAKVFRAELHQLSQLRLPVIAHWNENHYVVIDKINKNSIKIIDPAVGRQTISYEEFQKSYNFIVLEMTPTEQVVPQKRVSVWGKFLKYLMEIPKKVTIVIIIAIIYQLGTLGMPILVQYLIDNIITANKFQLLSIFMVSVIFLTIVQGFVQFFRGKFIIVLNNTLDKRMMQHFFSHILKLPYQFFQLRSFGDLLFRASSLRIIREMLSSKLVLGLLDFSAITFITIYMLNKSLVLTSLVVGLSLLNVLMLILTKRRLKEVNQDEILKTSQLQSYQTEFLYGIFGIKTAGIEKETYHRWASFLDQLIQAYKNKEGFMNMIASLSGTLQMMSPLLVLWIGAMLVFNNQLSLGELIAFYSLSNNFFSMSGSIVQTINSFMLTGAYLERVQDVLDEPLEHTDDDKESITEFKGNIRLDNVSFRYSEHSDWVVKDISLDIVSGQKIAIVGQSGAGKSTLAKLILGLYMPSNGKVYFDGKDIRELNLSALRKQIGVVPQDVSLFNRSIKDNISLYKEDVSLEEIQSVTKMAEIYEDIVRMPMGFNTMVSELGMNISGGQRQRIALARALLNKPSVILLDEATSSLDHQNEKRIDHFLRRLKCTRVVIAHKLTTIMDSDLIIVMENGEITALGTHHDLLKKSEFYAEFYAKFQEHAYSPV